MDFDQNHHVDDLMDMYAMDALDADEQRAVSRHLRACARCRAIANAAQSSVDLLARSADPIEPSAELKTRLFARIDADLAITRSREKPSTPPISTRARKIAFTAAVVVILGLFLFGLSLRTFDLPAQSAPPNAQAQLIAIPSLPTGLLRINGLKRLGAEETYEVWLIRGGKPEPALTFNVDSGGSASLLVRYDEPIGNIEQMAITIERAGGSSSPSQSAVVFYGALH